MSISSNAKTSYIYLSRLGVAHSHSIVGYCCVCSAKASGRKQSLILLYHHNLLHWLRQNGEQHQLYSEVRDFPIRFFSSTCMGIATDIRWGTRRPFIPTSGMACTFPVMESPACCACKLTQRQHVKQYKQNRSQMHRHGLSLIITNSCKNISISCPFLEGIKFDRFCRSSDLLRIYRLPTVRIPAVA